jgi:hypothetical protein
MISKMLKSNKPAPKSEPEVKAANKATETKVTKTETTTITPAEVGKLQAELVGPVKPEDQNAVKAEDQKTAPVVKKKSDTVVKWRAQDGFKPEQVITLLRKDNPKRRGAGERFAKYVDGMSVQAYIDVMKGQTPSRTAKQTMGDIRWDVASEFISIK